MTTPGVLFSALTARGVRLSAGARGKLRVDAPPGALSEEDWSLLATRKAELLDFLARLDADLAEVLRLCDQSAGRRPVTAEVLAACARGYRERGEAGMLRDALAVARGVVTGARARKSAAPPPPS
jgi:hypothetical protein